MAESVHELSVRIYYEDTDLAGIVYYANYLKFIERGRSEWVRAAGIDQMALKDRGVIFAVRHIVADYLQPAHFGEDLVVTTRLVHLGGARISLGQAVLRGCQALFQAEVTLVCVGRDGRPMRVPREISDALAVWGKTTEQQASDQS